MGYRSVRRADQASSLALASVEVDRVRWGANHTKPAKFRAINRLEQIAKACPAIKPGVAAAPGGRMSRSDRGAVAGGSEAFCTLKRPFL